MNSEYKNIVATVSTPLHRHNGFFYPRYNLLVTSYKAVKGFRQVIYRCQDKPKQKVNVLAFDPVYGVAFYSVPYMDNLSADFENYYLPNVGQHVQILLHTVSSGVITTNAVVIKFHEKENIPFFHIKSDFQQNLVLGALVLDNDEVPLGIVTDIVYDRLEVLPFKHLVESILDLADVGQYAFRCPYCREILTNDTVSMGKCAYCGQILPEHLYREREYIPEKYESKVNKIISLLNYNPDLARLDRNFWEIRKSDMQVFIYYDQKRSDLVAYTKVYDIPSNAAAEFKNAINNFLLETNARLRALTLSLHKDQVMLSTIYLNLETIYPEQTIELFRDLIAEAFRLKMDIQSLAGNYSNSSSM